MASIIRTGDALPTQTGQAGKILGTTGTSPVWIDAPEGGGGGAVPITPFILSTQNSADLTDVDRASDLYSFANDEDGNTYFAGDVYGGTLAEDSCPIICVGPDGAIKWQVEVGDNTDTSCWSRALTVTTGRVFCLVRDSGNSRVLLYALDAESGALRGVLNVGDMSRMAASGGFLATVGNTYHLLIVDRYLQTVMQALATPAFGTMFALRVASDGDGNVYVATTVEDTGPVDKTSVWRVDWSGGDATEASNFVHLFSVNGFYPSEFGVDQDGNIYMGAATVIHAYSNAGEHLWSRDYDLFEQSSDNVGNAHLTSGVAVHYNDGNDLSAGLVAPSGRATGKHTMNVWIDNTEADPRGLATQAAAVIPGRQFALLGRVFVDLGASTNCYVGIAAVAPDAWDYEVDTTAAVGYVKIMQSSTFGHGLYTPTAAPSAGIANVTWGVATDPAPAAPSPAAPTFRTTTRWAASPLVAIP